MESESTPVLTAPAKDADDEDAAVIAESAPVEAEGSPVVAEAEEEVVLDAEEESTPSLGRAVAQSAA